MFTLNLFNVMAANTQSGTGIKTRWFQIGRKNFLDAGDAVFREYIKEPPTGNIGDRQIVRHPKNGACYEQFESIDGIITGIKWEPREIAGQQQTMMIVTVEDAAERFTIEIGNWDGRFSKNLMQRLCQPNFNPLVKSVLKPYVITATSGEHAGATYMGVTIYNGIDANGKPIKIDARYSDANFQLPEPEVKTEIVITGPETSVQKEKRDFRKQCIFLVNYIKTHVIPKLPTDVFVAAPIVDPGANEFDDDETSGEPLPTGIKTNVTANHSIPPDDPFFPTQQPPQKQPQRVEPMDDLPF